MGEVPGTNASHLYRVEPRLSTNVSSPSDVVGGHFYRVKVQTNVVFSFL
jgi:hypothetical protein